MHGMLGDFIHTRTHVVCSEACSPLRLTLGGEATSIDYFLANFAEAFSNVGCNLLGSLGMHSATDPLLVGRFAEDLTASFEVLEFN